MATIVHPPTPQELSERIAVPSVLKTEDGRQLKITRWAPVIEHGCIITVSIEAHILKSDSPSTLTN